MQAEDLFNALNVLYFWLVELFKALGQILLIPLYLLSGAIDHSFREFLWFARFTIWDRFNELKKFGVTIRLRVARNTPNITIRTYYEDVDEQTNKLNAFSFPSVRASIAAGLSQATRFSYVIFDTYQSGHRFVQCNTTFGVYLLDFPLTPYTHNRDHAVEILKLLHTLGFSKHKNAYLPKSYSIIPESNELTIIQANLGTDYQKAVDIIARIHTRVFNVARPPEIALG